MAESIIILKATKACGTNLKVVREALSYNIDATVIEKDLPNGRLTNKSQALKRANTLRIIRFSLSTICILVPLLVLGGMAASGILLNQPGINLIIWIGILALGLGMAFDWEIE